MMCRWNSQITSDCWPTTPNPSHPLWNSTPPLWESMAFRGAIPPLPLPPPMLRGSAYFSYLVPYHRPVCRLAHGHTGVFHKNFLWYKLSPLIYVTNPFVFFLLALLFAHLGNTSLPKNVPLFCRTIILRNPFPALLLLHLPFNKPMPITYFVGIKRPCNSTGTQFLGLRGKGRWAMISNNGLRPPLPDLSNFNI